MLLRANNIAPQRFDYNFEDVPGEVWFAPYVQTAVEKGLIDAPSETNVDFNPTESLSRAAFLKMAIEAFQFSVGTPTQNPYEDVSADAWFAPYFLFAKQNNLFPGSERSVAEPGQMMTRGEAAEIIYTLSQLRPL
jgi:hypothetical protein